MNKPVPSEIYKMQTTDSFIINDHSKSRIELLGIGILLLIAAGFFYPMLFDGKVIFYRDYNLITYPIRYFLGQTFNQGAIPYWVPHANGGMPFMAAFHPGVFYPPSLLFFLDDTTYALNLFYVLHFMILGVFAFLLARSWNLSFVAALCCGITGMLSGFMMASTLVSNFFIAAVWLPMIFWMFHQFWVRKHIGYFIGLIVAIATQTLAACPEISIMTMLLLYAHSLCFLPGAPGFPGIARMTASLGLAVILALGLSALQLVPTANLIKHSFRDGGLNYETHTHWSMQPSKFVALAIPPDYRKYINNPSSLKPVPEMPAESSDQNTPKEPSADFKDHSSKASKVETREFSGLLHTVYMGLISLVLALLCFFFRREKAVIFWGAVFLLGVFLALGKYNPLYEAIYYVIPFLALFRYPEKYFYISAFAIVFLTGYGLDFLIHYTRERQIKIFRVLTVFIVLFGVIGMISLWKPSLSPGYSLVLLIAFSFSYVMFYFKKMGKAWFAALVLMMILVDLSIKGIEFLPLIDRQYYDEKPLLTDSMSDSFGKYRVYSGKLKETPNFLVYPNAPTRRAGVIAGKEHLYPFMGMIYGLEHVNGFPGLALEPKDNILWKAVFVKSPPDRRERILIRSNVKYWIDGDRPTAYLDDYPFILPDRLKILKDALPRAYLVPKMKIPKEGDHVLNTYYSEAFNPREAVLLDEKVDFNESAQFQGEVGQVVYRPNHVTVKTRQEGSGFLVLMDSYFSGWTVRVDDQERPILRANHFYRAVQLGPGQHTLEFDFVPEGMKTGLVVSGFNLLLVIFGSLFLRKYIKRII
jgi:membrane protein YfhO